MKTVRAPQITYTGPLPSTEELDQACEEVMHAAIPPALCEIADASDSLRALLTALEETCKQLHVPPAITGYQGYNLIRGIMIGILAERRRRNGGVQ